LLAITDDCAQAPSTAVMTVTAVSRKTFKPWQVTPRQQQMEDMVRNPPTEAKSQSAIAARPWLDWSRELALSISFSLWPFCYIPVVAETRECSRPSS
jgi:hypothetical protein